ncbi:hypothetical protein EKO27_g7148 [Xylaria grammica]|uniref:Receptor L-domain domain-containing protein n=1 Tax=Xylaria grammica TaxID=363999 RepID=A0A439D0G2_9PEZI|nr:hypothetical protein EKO27_g7148 [Xylaria grammica]
MRQLLSLPSKIYTNGDYTLPAVGYGHTATSVINITGSPSLYEIDLQAATGLHVLELRDVPPWSNPNITSVVMLEANSSLESSVVAPSAYDLTLKLSPIASVGSNAFVTSNENVHIELGNLASVRGNLSIHNNRNCTFDFDHLTEVGNLLLVDNQDTPLPSFPSLARVNTIHLRGHIDKTNIFPALTSVSDTVTIEAWNDDFNCAKLVSQHLEGTIPNLICNGTNNGTETSNGGPASWPLLPPPAYSLSEGAKAGIGVGGIAGVLGAVIAIIWLVLRFKIQLKELSQKDLALRPVEGEDAASIQGPESREIIQEMPYDPIYELQGRVQAHLADGRMVALENPGDEIHELPSTVAELPSTPALRT